MNILTAEEFKAQGTSPWSVISIARTYMTKDKRGNPVGDTPLSQRIRKVADELAVLTGVSLADGRRRVATKAKPANDNRRQQYKRAA